MRGRVEIKDSTKKKICELISRYPALEICRDPLNDATEKICECFRAGHKILICGNGGSAADSMHIVGELMKSFLLPRSVQDFQPDFVSRAEKIFPDDAKIFKTKLQCALPAISLVSETALNTAFANDCDANLIFAQQVFALGQAGDVLLAISTSGNSENIIYAAKVAKLLGVTTIALTGRDGGKLKNFSDCAICAPADSAYTIQEFHLPIYHALCIAAENELFGS